MAEVRTLYVRVATQGLAPFSAGMTQSATAVQRFGANAQMAGRGLDDVAVKTTKAQKAAGLLNSTVAKMGLAAGVAVLATQIGKLGVEYERSMNTFRSVTQASEEQMKAAGAAAKDLGDDLTLPGVSAADAAAAMTELAKGGLSVEQSMRAAQGTLQLAGAAGIDAARAAEIQSAALSQFRLGAEQANFVADVLANTANAAQGEITDMALALKYVGPVANGLGVTLDDTATAVGLLAKNGILADQAGTALRGMLASMAGPSDKAKEGLETLGIQAFDSSGKFVGFRSVIESLSEAQARLTDEQFTQAAAFAFGREPLAAITALAAEGAPAFDDMSTSVNRFGGASDVAAAKAEGLGGAVSGFVSQLETLAIELYERTAPGLEAVVEAGSAVVPVLGDVALGAVDLVSAALDLLGPLGDLQGLFSVLAGFTLARYATQAFTAARNTDLLGRAATGIGGAVGTAADGLLRLATGTDALGNAGQRGAIGVRAVGTAMAALSAAGPMVAITGLTYAVTAFIGKKREAESAVRAYTDAIQQDNGAMAENTRKTLAAALAKEGVVDAVRNSGVDLQRYTEAILGNAEAEDEVTAALRRRTQADFDASGNLNASARERERLLGILQQEKGRLSEASQAALDLAAAEQAVANATGPVVGGLEAVAAAAGDAAPEVEELTDAQKELEEALAGFIDPLGAYTGLLSQKQQKEEETARKTAESTKSQEDSWDDYVGEVHVSLDEYLGELRRQVEAQNSWEQNMLRLAGRVSSGTLQELGRLGPEGAPLVAELVTASDEELQEMERLFAERSANSTGNWRQTLEAWGPVQKQLMGRLGKEQVDALTTQLAAGTTTVAQIALRYGVELAGGINPILEALGKQPLSPAGFGRGGLPIPRRQANGSVMSFGSGGVESHVAEIAPPGAWRVWAEPETGGEAYIPLAPSKRDRSLAIWEETGRRLGALESFAIGGFYTPDDVPPVPSTKPYRPPISTAGDETMRAARRAVTDQLAAQASTGGGSGPHSVAADEELSSNALAAKRAVLARFGRMAIGGWGRRPNPTEHDDYIGGRKASRALDFMTRDLRLGNAIADFMHTFPGATYSIWNRRIRRVGGDWRPYSGRSPHTDHVHTSFRANGGISGGLRSVGRAVRRMAAGGVVPTAGRLTPGPLPTSVADAQARLDLYRQQIDELDRLREREALLAEMRATGAEWARVDAAFHASRNEEERARLMEQHARLSEEGARQRERLALMAQQEARTRRQLQLEQQLADVRERGDRFTDRLGELRDLLEQEARLRERLARSQADYTRDRARAEEDYARNRAEAAAAYARQVQAEEQSFREAQQRILDDRARAIRTWIRLDERIAGRPSPFAVTSDDQEAVDGLLRAAGLLSDEMLAYAERDADSIGAITANVREQNAALAEWMDGLADLRSRGLSEDVISALGLDDSPAALGQIQAFRGATAEEIAALNAEVVRTAQLAGRQVGREQAGLLGEVGQGLRDLHAQHTERLASMQDEYHGRLAEMSAAHAERMDAMQAEFIQTQAELGAQLAQVGFDNALGYGQAIANGLASSLPAIQAQARLVQQALRGLSVDQAALASGDADMTARVRAIFQNRGVPIATAQETEEARLARIVKEIKAGRSFDDVRRSVDMIRMQQYDVGGILEPGWTLAYNGTGRREFVTREPASHARTVQTVNVRNQLTLQIDARGADQTTVQTIRREVETAVSQLGELVAVGVRG